MDLLLNIKALQPVKISTEPSSSRANIGVFPGGKKGTYKITCTQENIDMSLKSC